MTMKLLLVDDDILICSALSRSLVRMGHASRTATSVKEALSLLEAEAPSAVLTDLDLGAGGNGIELIKELRQRGYAWPTILMTGSDLAETRGRLESAGLSDIPLLGKPFEIDALMKVFGEIVATATRPAAPSFMGSVVRALSGRVM